MKRYILTNVYQRFPRIGLFVMTGLLLGLCGSCDSFVEVSLPNSQLTAPVVFEDKNTANAAMSDIYSKLRDSGLLTGGGSGMSASLGAYADELDYYGSATAGMQFYYYNSLLPTTTAVGSWWSVSYNQIYAANAVYEGVAASTQLSTADKEQLMGEALFVRGLVHFYLVTLYGAVPYVTTTDYQVNQTVTRMPEAMVYEHIVSDLETAVSLLPETYFGGVRVRPNTYVANALLARVYLYQGDWAAAANAASAVLNETATYSLPANLDAYFLRQSTGTIWQLIPKTSGRNTDEGASFIFTAGPPGFVALRSELLAAFETGDVRKTSWVKPVTNGTSTWYHAFKYKQRTTTPTTQEYSVVLRLSEQYLIRAEARAQQGDLIGAKEDLNIIRARAGLAATTAVTQQEVLDAIHRERRVELFTEHGHRFFDLKRTAQLNSVLAGVKPGWNATDALLPLPESELLLNPNLAPQNPGY